jgi:SAM-dependent methyltransferase
MPKPKSTVIVDQYKDAATQLVESHSYGGLRIHALPGLHEFLGSLISKHVERGSTILDLAAGSGAMSLRLQDLGYAVSASDYVTENFKPKDIPFLQANLNDAFAHLFANTFHAIIASEIIEHLENPRHFLRECHQALSEGGIVLLSTPNLQNARSMASFIRSGEFLWFSDRDYRIEGHITPITSWQIGHILREAGFRTLWVGSFGDGSSKIAGSPRLTLLAKVLEKVSKIPASQRGEILVFMAQKSNLSAYI